MSTRGYELHRAVVHEVDSTTHVARVMIPALLGQRLISVPDTAESVESGDVKMVAVSPERDQFLWIV